MRKIVEVDLQAKGTDLHDATVVGDTVGRAQNIAPHKWVECYRCYSAICGGGGLAVVEEGGEEAGGGDVGEEDGGFVAEAHVAVEQA